MNAKCVGLSAGRAGWLLGLGLLLCSCAGKRGASVGEGELHGGGVPGAPPAGRAAKLQVLAVEGQVEASAPERSEWQALALGQEIAPGTLLRVGKGGSAKLLVADNGSVIGLASDTLVAVRTLEFGQRGEEQMLHGVLDLLRGNLSGGLTSTEVPARFELRTPGGSVMTYQPAAGQRQEFDFGVGQQIVWHVAPSGFSLPRTEAPGKQGAASFYQDPWLIPGLSPIIPEPGTAGLLLVGLGLLSFVLRRRR